MQTMEEKRDKRKTMTITTDYRRRWITIAAAVAGLGLVAVCRAGANMDACQLISAAQASKILGSAITSHPVNTSAAGPGAGSMCGFAGKGTGSGFMLITGRIHYTNAAQEVARRKKEALSDIPPGIPKPSFVNVTGLGDAAYLAKTSAYFQLHVLDHGNVIVINRNTTANTKTVREAKEIARAVLAHLQ
ncbi:MAG: hypothetical protein P8173_00065 [Gammaproteobacteria bacterium]|jgi:hypothetical protein